jgi:2-oxo-4-hydroxy-4-carboxy-5-ureidoimidazoline decarboxylase
VPVQSAALPVARLDELGPDGAAEALLPCCASRRWATAVAAGRPYGALDRLTSASDSALATLDWPDIEEALAAHPRIGARPAGPAEREAAWSAQEQRGAAGLDAAARDELRAANVAYEERFGHVFLICATGKSAAQMLAALRERLGHEAGAEREVVRAELREIVALRLAKAFS